MNQITELAETIESKQISDLQKSTEKYEIQNIRTDNNQFNMTIVNTGDLPIHLTRLWVENTTDSSWPISKYDLDIAIPTGGSVDDIGQNLGLSALDTASYMMILVTERGNTQKMFVNGIGAQSTSVYLNLRATPTVVPTGFTSTIILEVINTGTNQLLNVQPKMDSVTDTCTSTCDAVLVSGPTPTSFDSLDPGDIATFEWVYTVTGNDSGDLSTFTASLINGLATDTTTVSIKTVESAENAEVSLESGGVANDAKINDSILIFHLENDLVPSPGYQMMSSDVDGGSSGLRIDMETKLAVTPLSFLTNNGTKAITIPAGNWVASLALRSEPVATGLKDQSEDMIFHFEDGDGVNPDNSEGNGNRDLEECGLNQFQERISRTNDDAEQKGSTVDRDGGGSSDFELAYDGTFQHIGVRWSLDVPQGATITSADIRWRSDESHTGGSPDLIIGAEDVDNAGEFVETSNNISDRWASVTSATVTWNNINGWSIGEEGSDTTTPDLKTIVQEIVNRPSWVSGNNIVFIFKDNSGGSDTDRRTAEHYDAGGPGQAARLTVNYGSTGSPDWQVGTGPHGSGSYYYDGITMCHRSIKNVSGANGNDIDTGDNTTSLWFRTDGVGLVSSEQMLVFWEGSGTYPNSDYYKISLGEDGTGKLLFEYDTNLGTATTTCRSTNEYDDGNWYNVIATRDASQDSCALYITDIAGADTEAVITQDPSYSSSSVNVDGKWYVATNQESSNYFKGWVDDVMHWNDDMLSSDEADDLSKTDYGTDANQIDFNINLTDQNGNFVSNLYNSPGTSIVFQDSKGQSDTTDGAYSMFNVTMSLPQVVIAPLQRLNFSMSYVPTTATNERLELDMKIDDSGFTSPYPSYMQIPMPDNPIPSYVIYDNDVEFNVFVTNTGNDGLFYVFSGTRVTFNGTNGAFASLIHYVNSTNGGPIDDYKLKQDIDSIYIPSNKISELLFYAEPTDHPCNKIGNQCKAANIVPPGTYRVTIWINGYSDQGETFGRSLVIGTVTVVE